MKLSASNIAWSAEDDIRILKQMKDLGYQGLEIAPTRWFPQFPYALENATAARKIAQEIREEFHINICSMQSILYGVKSRLFYQEEQRKQLFVEVKKAIDFAAIMACPNLVFGSPVNRCIVDAERQYAVAVDFFKALGNYAAQNGVVLAIEANPVIYNTNFINETEQAAQLVKDVDSKGFLINLDVGTMLYNEEPVCKVRNMVGIINHVHISEPNLLPIQNREIHKELLTILKDQEYKGYVSIEMKNSGNAHDTINALNYLATLESVLNQ